MVYKNISPKGNNLNSNDYSPLIFSDEQRIMQVLLGLQSNALKFTKNGSVTIYAEIEQRKDLCFYLKISVA